MCIHAGGRVAADFAAVIGTSISVIARRIRELAVSCTWVAVIVRTGISIFACFGCVLTTNARNTGVGCTNIVVIAWIGREVAPNGCIAFVFGAWSIIVAFDRRQFAKTGFSHTGIGGTGVAVVAINWRI